MANSGEMHVDALLKQLAENLRRARRAAGLTQKELATKAGVGSGTIARIETRALDDLSLSTLVKLAAALDVAPCDLMPAITEPQTLETAADTTPLTLAAALFVGGGGLELLRVLPHTAL
jgi:transcriptional regulator with XRE-family HTH domain